MHLGLLRDPLLPLHKLAREEQAGAAPYLHSEEEEEGRSQGAEDGVEKGHLVEVGEALAVVEVLEPLLVSEGGLAEVHHHGARGEQDEDPLAVVAPQGEVGSAFLLDGQRLGHHEVDHEHHEEDLGEARRGYQGRRGQRFTALLHRQQKAHVQG